VNRELDYVPLTCGRQESKGHLTVEISRHKSVKKIIFMIRQRRLCGCKIDTGIDDNDARHG
jgi:hypothetical protein